MSKPDYPSSLQATPGAGDSQDITAWGHGFESEKFSTVLKKMQKLPDFPKAACRSSVLVLFYVSIFAKTV